MPATLISSLIQVFALEARSVLTGFGPRSLYGWFLQHSDFWSNVTPDIPVASTPLVLPPVILYLPSIF